MEYLKRERALLLEVGVPAITTPIEGQHVLIVVRGYHYREDLAVLRPYIREYRPVIIGGTARTLWKPDTGLTSSSVTSTRSLTELVRGAELVVHATDGRALGLRRSPSSATRPWCFPPPGPARTWR